MPDLTPLIEQVEADEHTHVVVTMDPEGIRWWGETEIVCRLMADLVGNAKVMPRTDFIKALREVNETC